MSCCGQLKTQWRKVRYQVGKIPFDSFSFFPHLSGTLGGVENCETIRKLHRLVEYFLPDGELVKIESNFSPVPSQQQIVPVSTGYDPKTLSSHILQAELVLHGGVRGVQCPHPLRHLLRSVHGRLLPASGQTHQFGLNRTFATRLPVSDYFGS